MHEHKLIALLSQFALLWSLCFQEAVYALPEDKSQPINLSADSADLNQSTHCGEYIGQVNFRQGSSHIEAHRAITMVNKDNKLTKAIAYGNANSRAHFSTLTDKQKPRLDAYADIIRYFPVKHLIELEGHAKVTQGKDRFEADMIRYDTLNQHVLSNSNGRRRTLIVINSDKIK